MRRGVLGLALAMVVAVGTWVQAADIVTFETITVSTTAVGLAAATTDPPGQIAINRCMATAEGADARYRWSTDGTAPTASVGQILFDGQSLVIESHADASRIQFIRDAGVDVTLTVHCWLEARP